MNGLTFHGSSACFLATAGVALCVGCGLFEPRTPEDPSQSGLNYVPPTDPAIVISNLQASIDQKNAVNYVSNFADPMKQGKVFVFIPSVEASAQYGAAFMDWTLAKEEDYFRNLIARSPANAFSNLLLTRRDSIVTADSVVYEYDYILTFEHSETGFPPTARGRLQFTLSVDPSNFWSINRWIDYSTTNEASWSLFKGKFSN